MPTVTEASAPGKLILFGEHAVVYGATAIAGALSDLRIFVRVTAGDVAGIRITIPDITSEVSSGAEYSYTWSTEDLRALLSSAFRDHADPATAFKPNASTLAALDAATKVCDATQRKGMIPSLFLTVAIFASAIFNPSSDIPFKGLNVLIHKATLPIAAGLGSSAAFSVATAAALLDMYHKVQLGTAGLHKLHDGLHDGGHSAEPGEFSTPPPRARQLINDWAYSAEMLFHGAPSGLDNTVSTFGGAIAYSKSPQTQSVSIRRVDGMPPLRIMITNTKVPKETSKLVAGVRTLHDELPAVIDPIIAAINAISNTFLKNIEAESIRSGASRTSVDVPLDQLSGFRGLAAADGDEEEMAGGTIGTPSTTAAAVASRPEGSAVVIQEISDEFYAGTQKLMRINHNLLNALGVGHQALDGVCSISARGGCITKLTGAGGGGCAITLLPPHNIEVASSRDLGAVVKDGVNVPAIRTELASLGYDCFETCLGGAGVLLLH